MTYEEIRIGQRVRIGVPRRPDLGEVVAKERRTIAGRYVERIYVNTARGRRVCAPSVLEPIWERVMA